MSDPRQSRDRILDAAIRLFGEGGLEAFSAAAIAREIGTSKANVFHHFPRLDEVPLAALERLAQQMIGIPDSSDQQPLRDWLIGFGRQVFSTVLENRQFLNAYFAFFSKALFDDRLRAPLKRCSEHTEAVIANRLAAELTPGEIRNTAILATSTLDGLVMRLLAFGDRNSAEEAWLRFVDLIAHEDVST